MKKLLLGLGTFSTAAASVVSVVSCGKTKQTDKESVNFAMSSPYKNKSYFTSKAQMIDRPLLGSYNHETVFDLLDKDFDIAVKNNNDHTYDIVIDWKTMNSRWNLRVQTVDNDENNYVLKEVEKAISKIKYGKDASTNLSLDTEDEKNLYMAYIYKRYDELWKDEYKDFSILNKAFPWMKVTESRLEKGQWNTREIYEENMWHGLLSQDTKQRISEEMKIDITKNVSLEKYAVTFKGVNYNIYFDDRLYIPKHIQRKMITDLLINKEWSAQALMLQEGMVLGGKIHIGGAADSMSAFMTSWSAIKPWENLHALEYLENMKQIQWMQWGMYHEFGHTQTMWNNQLHSFATTNNLWKEAGQNKSIKMFRDGEKLISVNADFNALTEFSKMQVPLRDIYSSQLPNNNWKDITTKVNAIKYQTYGWLDAYEFGTESLRQMDEVPFLTPSTFFDPQNTLSNHEVLRYASVRDLNNTPSINRNTFEFTNDFNDFATNFRKYAMGYESKDYIQLMDRDSSWNNYSYNKFLQGMMLEDFDFITFNNFQGLQNTIFPNQITKTDRNRSNFFTKDKIFSRELNHLKENRFAFTVHDSILENEGLSANTTFRFFKDTNGNGILDASDKLVHKQLLKTA